MTTAAARAPAQSQSERRARERAELWNTTYRALYGPPSGDAVPGLLAGELPSEELPSRLTRQQLVARPRLLRRLLAPLVVSKPETDLLTNDAEFRELVIAAARDLAPHPQTFPAALEELRGFARKELLSAPGHDVGTALRTVERLLAAGDLLVVDPATIVLRNGVSTIAKRARFRVPFADIARLVDPENWFDLGPFFEAVGPVAGERVERDDGWSGLFEEKFVVAWSRFRLQTYHTFLSVDHTSSADRVRTDYSLVYEVHDQIERDDGFIEVRLIPGRIGWCEYYAEKAMRFRSPQANMFAPMLMLVFLESSLGAIEDAALRHYIEAQRPVEGSKLEK